MSSVILSTFLVSFGFEISIFLIVLRFFAIFIVMSVEIIKYFYTIKCNKTCLTFWYQDRKNPLSIYSVSEILEKVSIWQKYQIPARSFEICMQTGSRTNVCKPYACFLEINKINHNEINTERIFTILVSKCQTRFVAFYGIKIFNNSFGHNCENRKKTVKLSKI